MNICYKIRKKLKVFAGTMIFIFLLINTINAEENPHADYMVDINTPANAKTNSLYEAWGENMSELIESGRREGIIIDSENYSNGKVHVDGVGNIVVDKNANTGAIVNNSEIKNSTIIIMKDRKSRMQ